MNRLRPYADDRVGASHALDPSTSREAAALNFPKSGSQRETVLKALAGQGSRGATFQELQGLTGIESAAKRLTELKHDGWAKTKMVPGEYGGEVSARRLTRSGATAEVYVATASAQLQLEAERAPHTTAGGREPASSLDADPMRDQALPSGEGAQPSAVHDEATPLFADGQSVKQSTTSAYRVFEDAA